VRAASEYDRVRNELFSSLADAFARYQTNRTTLQYYRDEILIDQVRAYRAPYERHQQDPDNVAFNDVVDHNVGRAVPARGAGTVRHRPCQWQMG
jgi:hypothetical protein